jgi:hypothetical protein
MAGLDTDLTGTKAARLRQGSGEVSPKRDARRRKRGSKGSPRVSA